MWKNFYDKVALEANPLFYHYITEEEIVADEA